MVPDSKQTARHGAFQAAHLPLRIALCFRNKQVPCLWPAVTCWVGAAPASTRPWIGPDLESTTHRSVGLNYGW